MSNQNPIIGRRMLHRGKVVTVVGAPGFQPALLDGDIWQFCVPCLDSNGGGVVVALDELEALPTEAETQPGVVNAGIPGTGEHAWPGPWVPMDYAWARWWSAPDDGADVAVFLSVWHPVQTLGGESGVSVHVEELDDFIRTAADAHKADAILATICRGPDPHPYPDALLAGGSDD